MFSKICFATRDHHLVTYKTDHLLEGPFRDLGKLDMGKGLVKGLDFIAEYNLFKIFYLVISYEISKK